MIELVIAVSITLGISAFCSLLEALLLSVSVSEIEGLKKVAPKRGKMLEAFKKDIEATSSAILSLNTIANTLGATITGGLAVHLFGDESFVLFSLCLTLSILLFSEILPKNYGVLHRKGLAKYFVYPMQVVRIVMSPLSWLCKKVVQFLLPKLEGEHEEQSSKDIILLAEKSAKEGTLSFEERDMILNALSMDDIYVNEIMTPRTVVTVLDKEKTLEEVFKDQPNILFARMPVFEGDFDNIVGIVRRRDMFHGERSQKVGGLMKNALFIPDTATAADALKQFLKHQQQLAIVVDEFGNLAGVVTLEDLFEHLIGKEIFEKDDVAVDMRELAMRKKNNPENK